MKLRARSETMRGQTVHATALPLADWPTPSVFVEDADGRGPRPLSAAATLRTYDVIDATPAERQFLADAGFPFGGIQ